MIQFITHSNTRYDYVEGARLALEGGCRWIQLRMKDAQEVDFLLAAKQIGAMCKEYGATFILDDHVEWVGIKNNSYYTWEEFEEQAKCVEYDADYSFEEIDRRLVVVGKDFWLERYEYDGSEWWEFKTLPTKPILKVDKLPILNEW